MAKKNILLIDALINFALGVLLGIFPKEIIDFMGMPIVSNPFYASILGGVLFGIGIALLLERSKKTIHADGLDLGGAIAINLSGGFVLALWLSFGALNIPTHGRIIMWSLVILLFGISATELAVNKKGRPNIN